MGQTKEKTPQEVVLEVQKKLDELLQENNCFIDVEAIPSRALGQSVVVLKPVIVYNGKQ